MKKALLYISIIAAFALGCQDNPTPVQQTGKLDQTHQFDTANFTTIQWLDSTKNFDTVTQGEKVKIVFRFLNTGNKPLFLSEVRPGCGCTLADFTKGAILPGKQGEVTAEYDSNHGFANQPVRKSVFVTCNAKNKLHSNLIFTGYVKKKAA